MTPRWIIATLAIGVMVGATAYLAFVEHMAAAFVVFVLLLLLLLIRAFVAYLAWLSRPGHRGLKVFLAGGLLGYLHDRSSGRRNLLVRLLLGGPDLLLVPEEEDDNTPE